MKTVCINLKGDEDHDRVMTNIERLMSMLHVHCEIFLKESK